MPQTSEMGQREWEQLPWCHIYGQYHWHSEAVIEGTREALQIIRDAIDECLQKGKDTASDSLFVTDGEGYHVEIRVRNRQYLEQQRMPYTAEFARG